MGIETLFIFSIYNDYDSNTVDAVSCSKDYLLIAKLSKEAPRIELEIMTCKVTVIPI